MHMAMYPVLRNIYDRGPYNSHQDLLNVDTPSIEHRQNRHFEAVSYSVECQLLESCPSSNIRRVDFHLHGSAFAAEVGIGLPALKIVVVLI